MKAAEGMAELQNKVKLRAIIRYIAAAFCSSNSHNLGVIGAHTDS